ncbi:MAG: hypothetical protein RIN56_14090 [Sporomusaceae bacterium]|nr:hypothetical protein [Sporomusaceae bacterium]
MVDVNITDKQRRDGKQPGHAPWGGKQADLLSNPKATAVFPPTAKVTAIPKENTTESDEG